MFSSYKHLVEEAESQLDHSRLIALINNLGDGFLAVNEQGLVELSNSVALDLLDANELKGKSLYQTLDLVDANGAAVDLAGKLAAVQENFSTRDWSLKQSDGSLVYLYVGISPVRTSYSRKAGGGFLIILRDISREKSLETEREEFVSVASHELSTPVTIAEGNISNALLLAERSGLQETIVKALKSAHDQMLFLASLINDLSMLSRADRGRQSTTIEEVDIAELIKSLEADYQPQAAKKQLTLDVELDPKLPKITSSRLYIREILQNFITNSIKYTEKGSVKIKAVPSADGIELSVTDTGIGVDAAEQAKIFDKFFRSQDDRVRQVSGTGLGLYISLKLAKLLGGAISMNSQLDKGSTFWLHLPASAYHPAAAESSKTPVA